MTTKLKGVVAKAMKDRKFLKALLKNPEKAVKGWGLTKKELTQLKTLVKKTNNVPLKPIIDLARYGAKLGILPKLGPGDSPPPPWPTGWIIRLQGKKLGKRR